MEELDKSFFAEDTLSLARGLVGKVLFFDGLSARIVETEAYTDDGASHARSRTPRSELMWSTSGHVYVYLIYGMYYCLNFTSGDSPGAVLIRACEPVDGMPCDGPGKLCRSFGISLEQNGLPVGEEVKVFDDGFRPDISTSARVGISLAKDLPWRFLDSRSVHISRKTK